MGSKQGRRKEEQLTKPDELETFFPELKKENRVSGSEKKGSCVLSLCGEASYFSSRACTSSREESLSYFPPPLL